MKDAIYFLLLNLETKQKEKSMKKVVVLLLSLILILAGCSSKDPVSNTPKSEPLKTESEIKIKEIDNVDLMGRTGITVGYADAIPGNEKDHYTIMTRKKDDIRIWLYFLKNQQSELEYMSEIQFNIANGSDGFDASIDSSKDYIAGTIMDKAFGLFTNMNKKIETAKKLLDLSEESLKSLPYYEEFASLKYDKSEEAMNVLINLVYFNYYPDVEYKDKRLFDKNGKLLMRFDDTGDNNKWLMSYGAEFRKFDDSEFILEQDATKRKEQIQLLTFDVYQLLNGKQTQTAYGEYAQKAVDWYMKAKNQKQINPEKVLKLYNEALENPESESVTNKFREKIAPLLKQSEETMGEAGPPNELLPEVRLKAVQNNFLWTKVEVLEFANESYKTGRSLRLTAIYDHKSAEWYLDDIEILEAADRPFLLTWEEVEKYAALKGLEIQKSDEQLDAQFFEFFVLNDNQMYGEGSILKIDRNNGLISFVSTPEEDEESEDSEEPEDIESTIENQSADESTVTNSNTGKTNFSALKDYEGKWKDANGIYFLTIENIAGNTADIWLDICSNNCAQIKSVEAVALDLSNNTVSHHYNDDGWGNSGDFTLTLQPNGIVVIINGNEVSLSQ